MSFEIKKISQEVSTQEALQSGQRPQGVLSGKEKTKIGRFVEAHRSLKNAGEHPTVAQSIAAAERGKPQISAAEQAAAVASSGAGKKGNSSRKIFKQMYQALFSEDEAFLDRDLYLFSKSLKDRSISFIDSAPGLTRELKVLRKYLLAEIGESNSKTAGSDRKLFSGYKALISTADEAVIQDAIDAFSVSSTLPMSKIGRRDFVKAFAVIDAKEAEDTNDLIRCFKAYENLLEAPDFVPQMVTVKNALVDLLKRENINNRKTVNRTREHQIAARINAINFLIKTYLINKKFLDVCSRCALKSLPKLSSLIENCYQLIVGADLVGGLNAVIKNAVQVKADARPAKNIFISNYDRLVLQSDLLKSFYKNGQHRQHVVDGIAKNTRAYAVLSAGGVVNE